MNRSEQIELWRPEIKTIQHNLKTTVVEQFQNNVLRPILKFQHDILISLFQTSINKYDTTFDELSRSEKEHKIDLLFQKDLLFKNQSLGVVLGMMTVDEYVTYRSNAAAYNRRMSAMLKQRIMSTV